MIFASFMTTNSRQFVAILGDLDQRRDLYLLTSQFGPEVIVYFSAASQARYLRTYEPGLVPDNNPNGTPPSDHTVSTAFEYYYRVDPVFVGRYLRWFQFHWTPS